ncbi:hypothetical protein [Spiroplasma endosymbiont of Amphimallon solstitiale]|uniref:hypothetical protein n=1 Tax=Spiroplasma endosymbiont of Amphimallon solstitiale TaxID=3066288 RepID=UPI00313E84DF
MKIKDYKNEKNKDRKHEIKKIKLKSREDIALMSLLVLLERRINRKRIKLKNNGNHIKEWKKLRNKNKEKKWKKK